MLWIAPCSKSVFFRFYAKGIKLSWTICRVEALTTQCGIVIKVIILTLSTTLSCSSILIHILDSWFILTLHQENFKWTIAQKSSTLLGPAYLFGRLISLWFEVILYRTHPGLVMSSLLSRMEPHCYSRGELNHLWPKYKSSPRCLVTSADP